MVGGKMYWVEERSPPYDPEKRDEQWHHERAAMYEQQAEKAGNDDAQNLARVFEVRSQATAEDWEARQQVGMLYGRMSASIDRGGDVAKQTIAYVRGFLKGLDGKASARTLTSDELMERLVSALEAANDARPKRMGAAEAKTEG